MQEKDATTKSFMNKLTTIYETLCKILNALAPTPFTVNGADCSGAPVTAEATSTVQTVPHPDFVQKVQLCKPNVDPEVVCLSNDGGVTVVKGIVEFDTNTTPATKTIYLFDGSIATGYTVVPCSTKTFDTEFRQVCVDGQNWTQIFVFDKSVSMVAPVQIGWLDQNDAVVVAPSPTLINNINCKGCKKEIFATHDRFISVPGVPVGFVAYEMTNDLPTQGLDVSNAYFHLIYPTLNGVTSDPIGPQLTEYFANPQNGILWSDIAGVQAVIDFVLPSMGLSVGDVVYAINTSNLPIFFLSPTAVTELANGTYLHIYWGDTNVHSSYNEKADVTVIAANPNILLGGEDKCVGIQEIKEKDTCTGEETYRYVIENLNGDLVKVTDIYPNFTEADVLLECPAISKKVDVPNCAGTLIEKKVDSIVGAYLLNQENKHTEKVYDVLTAVFGGNVAFTYTAPLQVAISYAAATLANDTIVAYWTDFGDGYNDVGPSPDHKYNSDGKYEIKGYAITASGNKVLLYAKEVTIASGAIVYSGTNPHILARTYQRLVTSAFQDYCDSLLVGSPYNADGTPYTLVGDFVTERPIIIDELEDNADYQAIVATPKVQRLHENFVVTGTTPLVIPLGAISISITKTNNTGVVNISGDNGVNFPLTFNRENFADSVNEGYSTLSAYTITGTLAGTTYKVHIIR